MRHGVGDGRTRADHLDVAAQLLAALDRARSRLRAVENRWIPALEGTLRAVITQLDELDRREESLRPAAVCSTEKRSRTGAIARPDGPVVAECSTVVVISPNQVMNLRSRYGSAGNKDDRFDVRAARHAAHRPRSAAHPGTRQPRHADPAGDLPGGPAPAVEATGPVVLGGAGQVPLRPATFPSRSRLTRAPPSPPKRRRLQALSTNPLRSRCHQGCVKVE
jgi:hypothetical protein